jgi:hypothetical protein
MTDDTIQRVEDAEEHRRSYAGIMRASTEIGVPFALGLTMFFTQLVLGNGIFALVAGIATYVVIYFIVKLFFSH